MNFQEDRYPENKSYVPQTYVHNRQYVGIQGCKLKYPSIVRMFEIGNIHGIKTYIYNNLLSGSQVDSNKAIDLIVNILEIAIVNHNTSEQRGMELMELEDEKQETEVRIDELEDELADLHDKNDEQEQQIIEIQEEIETQIGNNE